VVEGLEELTQLTELHIASQNLPKGEKLHFDPRTLKTLSNCLIVLNISGNQLDTLDDIAVLAELQQLIANDNKLSSMRDIAKVLSRLLKLWKLDLYNNPIALKQKYRDRIVTMCHRLESLDGREVTELEREFLFSWKAMRKARHQHLIQKAMNFNEKIQVLSQSSTKLTPVHQPHTMPPLPVRQPTRVKLLQEKRKKLLMMKQKPSENTTNENPENAEKLHPDFHLPQITSEKRVLLTGINPQGNSFIPNQSQHVLSLFTQ
jgi:protein phosphatase 1 regulatory subunit 42